MHADENSRTKNDVVNVFNIVLLLEFDMTCKSRAFLKISTRGHRNINNVTMKRPRKDIAVRYETHIIEEAPEKR